MAESIRTEVTVTMVSACLLSLIACSSFDESFRSSLMRFHFVSSLDEGVEGWPVAKHQFGGTLKEGVHWYLTLVLVCGKSAVGKCAPHDFSISNLYILDYSELYRGILSGERHCKFLALLRYNVGILT